MKRDKLSFELGKKASMLVVLPRKQTNSFEEERRMSKKTARRKEVEIKTETPVDNFGDEVPDTAWTIASLLIVAVGAVLRCYQLGLKPFHHDEGVNGFFMMRLVREGIYQYDPANYHGPSLYYFSLVASKLFGLNTIGMRLVPALFGIATIWLALCLRHYLGSIGALAAAALIAVSPGAVYLSRYFIHESLFVFFTFGIVVAALFYYDTGKIIYAILGAISLALLFATKETAFISVGVILIAWACVAVYMKIAKQGLPWDTPQETKERRKHIIEFENESFFEKFGNKNNFIMGVLIAAAVFLLVYVLFYSSFFTHKQGVADSIEAFKIWTKTGSKDHTQNGVFAYIKWLAKEEACLLILSAVGFLIALWKARHRFAIFVGAWAFGIVSAYTLIPYKTPWLALSFIIPLALISGYAIGQLGLTSQKIELKALALVIILTATSVGVAQSVSLNFYNYDKNDEYPYVYAHTYREFLDLVKEFEKYANKVNKDELSVVVVSEDYWPLPWYTRDYKGVGYYGKIVPAGDAQIVIGSETQKPNLNEMLADKFTLVGEYPLRPGVTLLLYVRNDLMR
jgi:uncharacterized protein (TIGR03663 family)